MAVGVVGEKIYTYGGVYNNKSNGRCEYTNEVKVLNIDNGSWEDPEMDFIQATWMLYKYIKGSVLV